MGVVHEDADAADQTEWMFEANLAHPNIFQRHDDVGSHRTAVGQRHIESVHLSFAVSLDRIHFRNFFFALRKRVIGAPHSAGGPPFNDDADSSGHPETGYPAPSGPPWGRITVA
ncbi:hypothetical protein [Mycobacterium simiae]|uniref:hypothetical protein n=1 Tax=Mycobacterium simiae TaxID=1784 RepID=UPI0012DDEEF7|nr:hypothetical protein [Mycobacterium simiae]BBX43078.1 hypothetical protein MSIM_45290 [Mycobacterium simiae]